MASIYKRGNSNIYYVALTGPDGKRMHLSTRTRIRKEAEKRAILIEDRVRQGLLADPEPGKRMKVKDLLKKYKVEISVDRKDQGARDKAMVDNLNNVFGELMLKKFDESNWKSFIKFRRKKGISDTTINKELRLLKHAFRLASSDWKLLHENPVKGFKLPKPNAHRERVITKSELRRICSCLPPLMRTVVIVGRFTGLRLSNIIHMRWAWVDLDEGVITIPAEEFKNGKKHEAVLNQKMARLFRALHQRRDAKSSYVFCLERSREPYRRDSATQAFRRGADKAKIEDVHFHDLRHTFLSDLAGRGVSVFDLMHAAGHKDIRSTTGYIHGNRARKRTVANMLLN